MADSFLPPPGPPPPKVPEGWKAIWNDQYKEWFYVNLHTKQSQWDKPEAPALDPSSPQSAPPDDVPPSYSPGANAPVGSGTDVKSQNLQSNNPYAQNVAESDEEMARRLQEEENAGRSGDKSRGASDSYYNTASQGYPASPSYSNAQPQQQQQGLQTSVDRGGGRSNSFFGKLKEKLANPPQRPMGAPMMGYNAGGYPPRQQYYNYPPQGQYGGYPQQGYGGYGGYPQQGYGYPMGMGQPVRKKHGLGAGGAAALGIGGGLIGGALLADGINDMQEDAYDQGFDDGADFDGGDF